MKKIFHGIHILNYHTVHFTFLHCSFIYITILFVRYVSVNLKKEREPINTCPGAYAGGLHGQSQARWPNPTAT